MKRACLLFLVAGAMVAVALLRPQGGGTETPSFELSSGSFGAGGGSASSASFGTESAAGGLTGGESSSASFGAGADFFSAATCVDDGDGLDAASEQTLGTNTCAFDTDGDGPGDGVDGCPTLATVWGTPLGDDDCDGFTTADENAIGCDPNLACGTNAWPPDTFEDQLVDGQDLVAFLPVLFKGVGQPGYSARFDIFAPGAVIDGQDLVAMLPFLFQGCTPP